MRYWGRFEGVSSVLLVQSFVCEEWTAYVGRKSEWSSDVCSSELLVDATGVNRASLYATYGDKRELFLASLRKYDGEVRRRMLADLAVADTAAQRSEARRVGKECVR